MRFADVLQRRPSAHHRRQSPSRYAQSTIGSNTIGGDEHQFQPVVATRRGVPHGEAAARVRRLTASGQGNSAKPCRQDRARRSPANSRRRPVGVRAAPRETGVASAATMAIAAARQAQRPRGPLMSQLPPTDDLLQQRIGRAAGHHLAADRFGIPLRHRPASRTGGDVEQRAAAAAPAKFSARTGALRDDVVGLSARDTSRRASGASRATRGRTAARTAATGRSDRLRKSCAA